MVVIEGRRSVAISARRRPSVRGERAQITGSQSHGGRPTSPTTSICHAATQTVSLEGQTTIKRNGGREASMGQNCGRSSEVSRGQPTDVGDCPTLAPTAKRAADFGRGRATTEATV